MRWRTSPAEFGGEDLAERRRRATQELRQRGVDDGVSGRDRMRAQIVEVVAGLMAAGGRDAVSTRAVAAAAGTQAPTIYRLFGDKDGLLAAVLEYGFTTYLAASRRSIRRPIRSPTSGPDGTCTPGSASRTRRCSC